MRAAGAALAGLALLATAAASVSAHTGGRNGYAAIAVDGAGVRYSLTLWPASVPPAMAETFRLAHARPELLLLVEDRHQHRRRGRGRQRARRARAGSRTRATRPA